MLNQNIVLETNKFKKSNILIDIRRSDIFKVWTENEHKLLKSPLYIYSQKIETEIEELKKGYWMYSSKKDYILLDKDINKMNSKYAMNIYQIIKIKQKQINPHTNKKLIEISYNLKELNEISNLS